MRLILFKLFIVYKMIKKIKRSLCILMSTLFVILGSFILFKWQALASAPAFDGYVWSLKWWVVDRWKVDKGKTLKDNIVELFYPNSWTGWNKIFNVIRDMTLWIMIIFIVWAWASLLINRDSKSVSKALTSLLYIMLWWVFIFWANWLFWSVLNFNEASITDRWDGIWWVKDALIWNDSVLFKVLSVVKVFAFFLAIIMIVVTWFKVISAWEWEKWKKLLKWLINVVVALLVIKWVDFIYYMAADWDFVDRTAKFIVDVAKLFAYLYWIVIVLMIIVAWYLYITDGWGWSWFKKASNLLVNILLSALVLFGFLLILYQIFAEFRTWWDAVTGTENAPEPPIAYVLTDGDYV